MKPLQILTLCLVAIAAALLLNKLFWRLVDFVQQKLNERAIRRILDRDDEPPLAI